MFCFLLCYHSLKAKPRKTCNVLEGALLLYLRPLCFSRRLCWVSALSVIRRFFRVAVFFWRLFFGFPLFRWFPFWELGTPRARRVSGFESLVQVDAAKDLSPSASLILFFGGVNWETNKTTMWVCAFLVLGKARNKTRSGSRPPSFAGLSSFLRCPLFWSGKAKRIQHGNRFLKDRHM